MSAGERITAPRCRAPVEFRELNRPRSDLDPVCWRPAGHAAREEAAGRQVRHMSRASYLHALESSQARRDRGRAAGMTDPAARVRP